MRVSMPLGKIAVAGKYVPDREIQIGREALKANLIVMPIEDYGPILGMDWLSKYGARVDCKNKVIQFVRPGRDVMEFKGNWIKEWKFLMARTKARNMLRKGCQGYLAYLLNKPKDQCTLEDTTVVKEFQGLFPAELTSLPPPREVDFTVDLIPGEESVSRTPYQMALAELKEVNVQLEKQLQ
jgi:hypothetical protein